MKNRRVELLKLIPVKNFIENVLKVQSIFAKYYPESQVEKFFLVFINDQIDSDMKISNIHLAERKYEWLQKKLNYLEELIKHGKQPDFNLFKEEAKKEFPNVFYEDFLNTMSELRSIFIKYHWKSEVDDFFTIFRNPSIDRNNPIININYVESKQKWVVSNLEYYKSMIEKEKKPNFNEFKIGTKNLFPEDYEVEFDDKNALAAGEYSAQEENRDNLSPIYEEESDNENALLTSEYSKKEETKEILETIYEEEEDSEYIMFKAKSEHLESELDYENALLASEYSNKKESTRYLYTIYEENEVKECMETTL